MTCDSRGTRSASSGPPRHRAADRQRTGDAAVRFGPGLAFSYAVEPGLAPRGRATAHYTEGCRDPDRSDDSDEWLAGNRVGFDHHQPVDGGVVRVLLEKDFACIHRVDGKESVNAYAFPNPSAVCSHVAVGQNKAEFASMLEMEAVGPAPASA